MPAQSEKHVVWGQYLECDQCGKSSENLMESEDPRIDGAALAASASCPGGPGWSYDPEADTALCPSCVAQSAQEAGGD